MRRQGLTLRPYFEGLPVRLPFLGGDARMVYYARPAVAIESQTGLARKMSTGITPGYRVSIVALPRYPPGPCRPMQYPEALVRHGERPRQSPLTSTRSRPCRPSR
jgi:hypothetical protein